MTERLIMNLNKLMKQAQKMQEQMTKTQAELEKKTIEVSAAGGKIKVTANGAGEIIAIKIDKEVVDPNDVEFLEEMLLSAVKQAIEQGKALAQSEMSRITGGLGIPGLQRRNPNDEEANSGRIFSGIRHLVIHSTFVISFQSSRRRSRVAISQEFESIHRAADKFRSLQQIISAGQHPSR